MVWIMDKAGVILGAASTAHLLFSMLLMLSGRRQLLDRSFANAILFASLLVALANFRFVLESEPEGPWDLWLDVLGDGAGIAAMSYLLVIVDRYRGRQRHLAQILWPAGLWFLAWTLPEVRQSEDLRILIENALFAVNFAAVLWAAQTAERERLSALRPIAVVSACGLVTACGVMGVIVGRASMPPAPQEPLMLLACQAPVLMLACTLPLVLFTLMREHETQIMARREALALQGRVAALKADAARTQLAQGIARVATYELNTQSNTVIASPSAREIFGLPEDGVIALRDVFARLVPTSVPILDRMRLELLNADAAGYTTSGEIEVMHPLRGRRLISFIGSRISSPPGMDPIITGAIIDITDRRAAKARVIHTAQLAKLGEVAAGVAHELRQPLNALKIGIANLSRQARSEMPDPEQLDARLARLARYIDRANNIIEAMRKLSRGPSEQQIRFDAGTAVRDALVLQTESARLQGMEISVSIEPDLMIMGDPARLEQAIFNLVSNAVYAVSQRSPLKVGSVLVDLSLHPVGDEIEIVVADNCPGIAPEVEARLFQAFNTNKPSASGTGLGLSIVHAIIVRVFQGSITATSSPNGARFVMRIPSAPAPVVFSTQQVAFALMSA